MSAHSIIAPSAAPRWAFCSGAPQLEAKNPETEESEPSREGTASHWVSSSVLSDERLKPVDFEGLTCFNGVLIDRDMVDSAAVYVAAVLAVCPDRNLLQVEKQITIPRVHTDCFGTPDCWYYDTFSRTLHIWDYKYGWGIVGAFENLQAICYYAGIVDKLGIPDAEITVQIHIAQPRPYHSQGPVRTWKVPAVDLRGLVNQLNNAAHAALAQDVTYCSGGHCKHCLGRHVCAAAQRAGYNAVDVSTSTSPTELTPEGVGIELAVLARARKALDYRITGLEAQGLALAKSGKVVPGHAVGHGQGSTVWVKPVGEVVALGDLVGKDLRKKEAVITPKQAETLGVDKTLLKSYSEYRPGKARLVTDDNTKAREIFGGNTV
jgi:hypothetical protein